MSKVIVSVFLSQDRSPSKRSGFFSPQKAQEALEQILSYMDKFRAKEGWLVVFDKDCEKPLDKKITWETKEFNGKTIHIVGA
jgi:hypothetical protein